MQIKLLLIPVFIFLNTLVSLANDVDASYLRKKFYLAVDDSKVAKDFIEELAKKNDNKEPLIKGYLAATNMVMAKHAINPYKKLKYFVDGKNELESAIKKNEKNVELRLIRFAVQSNAPFFLGYSNNINADKKYLIDNLASLKSNYRDKELLKIIVSYLQKSGLCTQEETQKINNISN